MQGKRAVIMGLGRFGGGVGAARYLAESGADVLVTDLSGEEHLRPSLEKLADLPIRYRLGEHHPEDFHAADVVVVNPAVDRRNNAFLREATHARLTTEVGLLLDQLRRERVIGVTGTAGKSTTTAMVGHILREALGEDRVHVGGNLGGSLLSHLDRIGPDDWVVLELSSFMLEALDGWSPSVAAVTNLRENHLDHHGTFAAYAEAKKTILRHQRPTDRAMLGTGVEAWADATPAPAAGVTEPLPEALAVPGTHNRWNGAIAVAVAEAAGVDRTVARDAVKDFPGLPHRLQWVAEHNGVRYYNDSKSTTPDATRLALDAFPRATAHLVVGGSDKGMDLAPIGRAAANHAVRLYTVGETGDALADAAEAVRGCPVHRCGTVGEAVRQAAAAARPGEAVVLSPGCASYDQFPNYAARGDHFVECVLRYTGVE